LLNPKPTLCMVWVGFTNLWFWSKENISPNFFQRGGRRRDPLCTHLAHISLLPNAHALEEHDLLTEKLWNPISVSCWKRHTRSLVVKTKNIPYRTYKGCVKDGVHCPWQYHQDNNHNMQNHACTCLLVQSQCTISCMACVWFGWQKVVAPYHIYA